MCILRRNAKCTRHRPKDDAEAFGHISRAKLDWSVKLPKQLGEHENPASVIYPDPPNAFSFFWGVNPSTLFLEEKGAGDWTHNILMTAGTIADCRAI
jgi:hypothetical protein